MGNGIQVWKANCRETKRTENTLFYVAVVAPDFSVRLTQIAFPPGWVYSSSSPQEEKETLGVGSEGDANNDEGGDRESARKRTREAYVQDYKRLKAAWFATQPPPPPPAPEMDVKADEEGEGGEEQDEEKKQAALAAAREQATRKRRREFKMPDIEVVPKKQLDATDTICRPFFRLLYGDTSIDFDSALDQVVQSTNHKVHGRLAMYQWQKWRMVVYILDHSLAFQQKYGGYDDVSGVVDLFRPERPFDPNNGYDTTRFVRSGAGKGEEEGELEAVSIIVPVSDIATANKLKIKLQEGFTDHYYGLYQDMREDNDLTNLPKEPSGLPKKKPFAPRGRFVDMQKQDTLRRQRQQQQQQQQHTPSTKPNKWTNVYVLNAMQHAAAEVQLRAHDTNTDLSPMLLFHLLCSATIEKIPLQTNANVWFNHILPHVLEIDESIKAKLVFQEEEEEAKAEEKAPVPPLSQAVQDLTFVLCVFSYFSTFELVDQPLQFTSMFKEFNARANGKRFELRLTRNSMMALIVAAAQSVKRTAIMMGFSHQLIILDKASPRQKTVAPVKPFCVSVHTKSRQEEGGEGGGGEKERETTRRNEEENAKQCRTVNYPAVALFSFSKQDSSLADSMADLILMIEPELKKAMVAANKKNQRACDVAAVPMKDLWFMHDAPSPWNDLAYYLFQLQRDCDAAIIADIVSAVQGIPSEVILNLLQAPGTWSDDQDDENVRKRDAAIRDVARNFLYSNLRKDKGSRVDPYMNAQIYPDLRVAQANSQASAIHLPSLEEAIALLQIS